MLHNITHEVYIDHGVLTALMLMPEPSDAPTTLLCMDSESGMRHTVPELYHDQLNVFSKRRAYILPLHRPYD